ncbi:trypsin-like serine protease [Ramicandelaber brevisporus]|nr:trypsin-like serine protease [Ramicandelaber brevisporus]
MHAVGSTAHQKATTTAAATARSYFKLFMLVSLIQLLSLTAVGATGTIMAPFSKRVIGGITMSQGSVNYMAHIGIKPQPIDPKSPDFSKPNGGGSDAQYLCSAAIIHPSYVVTAAHCFFDRNQSSSDALLPANRLFVAVGNVETAKMTPYAVQSIKLPKELNVVNLANDIAVVQLATPLTLGEETQLSAIKVSTVAITDGQLLTLLGWGRTQPNSTALAPVLQGVNVAVGPASDCSKATELFTDNNGKLICMAPVVGKGPCAGDGGSPLVAKQGNTQVLIGVLGFALKLDGSPAGQACASSESYSFFTHVSQYSGFITRATNLTTQDFSVDPGNAGNGTSGPPATVSAGLPSSSAAALGSAAKFNQCIGLFAIFIVSVITLF